ncbi:hypothetical protein GCM10017764_14460 [Sphingobacterium griseoflavum]|uniref:Uncharacterized protein n=1 Tax=Sphingobacterium griseoflavum TaxID=1474952 RepID=A0ABQ3HYP2_9SPHI|nr:hypothetical protein GCM10017764_14460 [Sphingobacterium griseoflavum]
MDRDTDMHDDRYSLCARIGRVPTHEINDGFNYTIHYRRAGFHRCNRLLAEEIYAFKEEVDGLRQGLWMCVIQSAGREKPG